MIRRRPSLAAGFHLKPLPGRPQPCPGSGTPVALSRSINATARSRCSRVERRSPATTDAHARISSSPSCSSGRAPSSTSSLVEYRVDSTWRTFDEAARGVQLVPGVLEAHRRNGRSLRPIEAGIEFQNPYCLAHLPPLGTLPGLEEFEHFGLEPGACTGRVVQDRRCRGHRLRTGTCPQFDQGRCQPRQDWRPDVPQEDGRLQCRPIPNPRSPTPDMSQPAPTRRGHPTLEPARPLVPPERARLAGRTIRPPERIAAAPHQAQIASARQAAGRNIG